LPFAALPGEKEGIYLLEEIPVAVVPVPQQLPEVLATQLRRKTQAAGGLLGEVIAGYNCQIVDELGWPCRVEWDFERGFAGKREGVRLQVRPE
jgi:hypothetical protein